jgi:hypothetical protein
VTVTASSIAVWCVSGLPPILGLGRGGPKKTSSPQGARDRDTGRTCRPNRIQHGAYFCRCPRKEEPVLASRGFLAPFIGSSPWGIRRAGARTTTEHHHLLHRQKRNNQRTQRKSHGDSAERTLRLTDRQTLFSHDRAAAVLTRMVGGDRALSEINKFSLRLSPCRPPAISECQAG